MTTTHPTLERTHPMVERIAGIFADHLHLDVSDPTEDLLATGQLDSLTLVELLVRLEETFDIQVRMEDLELDHLRTLQQIAGFVEQRLPGADVVPIVRTRSPVRAFGPEDVEEVGELHRRIFGIRVRSSRAREAHLAYFHELFLSDDQEGPPSLVYQDDDGRIIAFLGARSTRMRLGNRPLLGSVSTQFVAEPGRGAEAAQLASVFLEGPQDLSFIDEPNDEARRLWEGMGGFAPTAYALRWVIALRPAGMGLDRVRSRPGLRGVAGLAAPLARAADALLTRAGRRYLEHTPDSGRVVPLDAATVVRESPRVFPDDALYPAPAERTFEFWMRRLHARTDLGTVRADAVLDGEAVVGWYVALVPRDGVADVLQITALTGSEGLVLDHALQAAEMDGAVAMSGRLEPRFLETLNARRAFFHGRGQSLLVHTRELEIARAFREGRAALSRLEGELPLRFAPPARHPA
ncbi:MAG: acyl carrier protein [Myxococcota bacterium]